MCKVAVVRPVEEEGTVLVNIPVMKTHNLGILSTAVKNLQGLAPNGELRHFCGGLRSVARLPEDMVHPNAEEELRRSYARHVWEGITQGQRADGWNRTRCGPIAHAI